MAHNPALAVDGEDFNLYLGGHHAASEVQRVLSHRVAQGDAGCMGHGQGLLAGIGRTDGSLQLSVGANGGGPLRQLRQVDTGMAAVQIHKDAIEPGDKVIIVDDLLATGGTAAAVEKIVKQLGGNLVGFEFLIELDSLNGRKNLECQNINVQIHY